MTLTEAGAQLGLSPATPKEGDMRLGIMLKSDDATAHRIIDGKMTACGRRAWHIFDGNPDLEIRCRRCFPKP